MLGNVGILYKCHLIQLYSVLVQPYEADTTSYVTEPGLKYKSYFKVLNPNYCHEGAMLPSDWPASLGTFAQDNKVRAAQRECRAHGSLMEGCSVHFESTWR